MSWLARQWGRVPDGERSAVWWLFGLIAAGALLRLLLMIGQSPGFVSSTDSAYYLIAAHTNVFAWAAEPRGNPWPAGYPIFLKTISLFTSQLTLVIVIQHLLGIATAVLWFLSVRRVVSAAWGLLPAGVILLAGPQLFLEHAPLAEPLFVFLISATVFCTLRALGDRPLLWSALAGAAAFGAASVRVIGLALIGIVCVWLLVARTGDVRQRLLAVGAAGAAAMVLWGGYVVAMKSETGFGGPMLTRSGDWSAPAATTFGKQSYLNRVTSDLTRFWAATDKSVLGGYNYDGLVNLIYLPGPMTDQIAYPLPREGRQVSRVTDWYPTAGTRTSDGTVQFMFDYERVTRLQGPFFFLLVLLAFGVVLARGRQLAGGLLFGAVAVAVLLLPVLYLFYDARYAVPGYGPLAAVAAVGGAMLWERVAQTRAARAPAQRAPQRAATRGQPRGRRKRAGAASR